MTQSPRQVFERFIDAARRDDVDGMADCYAADRVIEMPFGPPLYPAVDRTPRDEWRERMRATQPGRRFESVDKVRLYETTDPEVAIGEFELTWTATATGRRAVMPYIMVMTIRDGRIVHSRDYASPLPAAQAMGRLPELVKALEAASA